MQIICSTTLNTIFDPISNELKDFDSRLINEISTSSRSLCTIMQDIFAAGGKRLRPALSFLVAKTLTEKIDEKVFLIAEIAELIHTASLVHDDIIDNSLIRRGKATVHSKWASAITVISGDFMFARAAVNLGKIGNNEVTSIFANVLQELCDGEIWQVEKKFDTSCDYEFYYLKNYKKTASLFEAACLSPTIVLNSSPQIQNAFKNYGKNLGMVFQIVDDILDFTADATTLGKPNLSDVLEGQINLPVLIAIDQASTEDKARIIAIIDELRNDKNKQLIDELLTLINKYQGIEKSFDKAIEYAQQAKLSLEQLAPSAAKKSLEALLDYVIDRKN
ncbi:MAG: polyprenyl synthetase family protein [Candidatus Caenarcaniphilales bacterium]|jgi:all-trans-nonaprenyl-diphosphate synthase|nr:polyprenyl synthetase family protein [Candidatus Caenarcaniphilales bacterium]